MSRSRHTAPHALRRGMRIYWRWGKFQRCEIRRRGCSRRSGHRQRSLSLLFLSLPPNWLTDLLRTCRRVQKWKTGLFGCLRYSCVYDSVADALLHACMIPVVLVRSKAPRTTPTQAIRDCSDAYLVLRSAKPVIAIAYNLITATFGTTKSWRKCHFSFSGKVKKITYYLHYPENNSNSCYHLIRDDTEKSTSCKSGRGKRSAARARLSFHQTFAAGTINVFRFWLRSG